MVKRGLAKTSSHQVRKKSRAKCSRSREEAAEGPRLRAGVKSVVEEILKSPTDDERFYRRLELENGVKVLLISDLTECDLTGSEDEWAEEDEEEERGPGCLDKDIVTFNEEVLGLKGRRACCKCDHQRSQKAEIQRLLRQRKKFQGTYRVCRGLSNVGLSVGAGSYNDPEDAKGLAHLCEHMAFMGSKKYPESGHFDAFLDANGGSVGWNGTTSGDSTSFYYDVMCDALKESLNILVSYFMEPLLPSTLIQKELEVVDTEFHMKKSEDVTRRFALLQHLGKAGHPACRFGWGNRESLDLSSAYLHRLLVDYFKKWYCPDNMTLVVTAPASLRTLEDMVLGTFGLLKRKETRMLSLVSQPFPYDTPAFRKLYRIVPFQDDDAMYIAWELPASAGSNYQVKPLEYMAAYFGSESKHGLSYYLRKKYWIVEMTAEPGSSLHDNNEASILFYMVYTLTDLGLQNIEQILEATFSYIKYVTSLGPLKWFFRQAQSLSALALHFKGEDLLESVRLLANDIRRYEPADVLLGPAVQTKWDPKAVQDCVLMLRPDRANYMISSKSYERIAKKEEPYLGVQYAVEDLPPDLLRRLQNVGVFPGFDVLPRNPFIATNFCPVRPEAPVSDSGSESGSESDCGGDEKEGEEADFPKCILETEELEIWHALQPGTVPAADVYFEFVSPLPQRSPHCAAMCDVWIKLLQLRLKPAVCAAEKAVLDFVIERGQNGVVVHIGGLSQRIGKVFDHFLAQVVKMESVLTPEAFVSGKELVLKDYLNTIMVPETLYEKLHTVTTSTCTWLENRLLRALKGIQFPEFLNFSQNFLSRLLVIGFGQGNILGGTLKRMGGRILKTLKYRPLVDGSIQERRIRQLPLGESILRVRGFNPEQSSAVYANRYQTIDLEEPADRRNFISTWLVDFMQEKGFKELRDKRQLGYDVCLTNTSTDFAIMVGGDSGKVRAGEAKKEIDKFMADFYENVLRDMSQAQLMAFINVRGANVGGEAGDNWAEIRGASYDFGRLNRENKIESSIMVEEVRDFYRKYLLPSSACSRMRKLCIQIVGEDDKDYPEQTVEVLPGSTDKSKGAQTVKTCERDYPLTFLTPIPKRTKAKHLTTLNNYVRDLQAYGRSLFLLPKKLC